jgi:hypothetical protein
VAEKWELSRSCRVGLVWVRVVNGFVRLPSTAEPQKAERARGGESRFCRSAHQRSAASIDSTFLGRRPNNQRDEPGPTATRTTHGARLSGIY